MHGARHDPAHGARTVQAGTWRAWTVAIRPRSLLVAVSPVLVGGSLGYARTGVVDWPVAAMVLGAALLMQVITNMQNDVGYTVRGGESVGTRTGLPRATANGWLSVRRVRAGIVGSALVALALGLALAAHRGWPVLAIGSASLLVALAYMGGPRPIAYTPFGEVTVFVFFGLVAVIGTDWVMTGGVGNATVPAAAALGSVAAAALAVNNHRDVAHDGLVGRQTFAVTFGERGSTRMYGVLLALPFVLLPTIAWLGQAWSLLLPMLLVPSTAKLHHDFRRCQRGLAFNAILFRTFMLELRFAALLSVGALASRWVA